MAKKINYNARTFVDYKKELNSLIKKYHPNVINDFNDASIGQFFIDINAAVADDLGFYSDRMFQETQIDQAQERKSLLNIARNNGLKIMGKRPSVVEAEWSCILPIGDGGKPDWDYAPTLKRGTQASGGGQRFELTEDINFRHQFNKNGIPDRSFIPVTVNGIKKYKVSKTCIMSSTESKIYKQSISSGDVEPFMEIILPENNVVKINSILWKDGYNPINPTTLEFMHESDDRTDGYERWYEVENLLDNKKFTGSSEIVEDKWNPMKGEWKPVTKKFITEYTDNGYCKITFGGGMPEPESGNTTTTTMSFSQYLINNMLNNSYLGEIPSADSTLFIYYSVGGGAQSNIGAGAMTNITYMDLIESGSDSDKKLEVRNSMKVVNTIPSVSGRDELTTEELRYLIKYNNGAQDRCVTITDYLSRVMLMPSEFGSPFKVGVAEENNKVVISLLGLGDGGNLTNDINGLLIDNIKNYLTEYKSINDYVEIRPGKIINLRFEVDITIENNMKQEDVSKEVGLKILDFMDINKHKLGDEIFISRLKSLIGMTTGVKNLIDLRVYNRFGEGYSLNHVTQPVINNTMVAGMVEINLSATDGVLYSNNDTMFEIKNPGENIILNTKYSI